jgi:DNA polymerase-3 subunit epsilon
VDGSLLQVDVRVIDVPAPTPWHRMPLAVIDTETTGLSPETGDRVIEVAVILFDGGEVTERWSSLCDPGAPLHADVTRITGITDADLVGQPRFADVVPDLHHRLAGRLLVAYNAGFDRNFLVHELARAGSALPQGARWLDPMVFAKEMQKGQGNMKLGTVAKRLGVSLEEAHRAAADAECAGRVLLKLSEQLPHDLAELLDLQERWEAQQEAERASWRNRAQQNRQRPGSGMEHDGPRNALGPSYPLGDELDPVRYMFLRAAGRG